MRIIAGSARGTKLQSLPHESLRPMMDRVRESLFNIIRPDLPGARVLDLFSGSGALGLEALSRGAGTCAFVERDRHLAALVRRNAERCHFAGRCKVVEADVLGLAEYSPPPGVTPAGVVMAGPPYALVNDPNQRGCLFDVLDRLIGSWIAPDAIVVLHHEPIRYALWPTRRLKEVDKRVYGRSQLTFFEVAEGTADA